jgi:hypothetical protein
MERVSARRFALLAAVSYWPLRQRPLLRSRLVLAAPRMPLADWRTPHRKTVWRNIITVTKKEKPQKMAGGSENFLLPVLPY